MALFAMAYHKMHLRITHTSGSAFRISSVRKVSGLLVSASLEFAAL